MGEFSSLKVDFKMQNDYVHVFKHIMCDVLPQPTIGEYDWWRNSFENIISRSQLAVEGEIMTFEIAPFQIE